MLSVVSPSCPIPSANNAAKLVLDSHYQRLELSVMTLFVMFQPQFDQLYRQVQTVAESDAELSQLEKCTLVEGLILLRCVYD